MIKNPWIKSIFLSLFFLLLFLWGCNSTAPSLNQPPTITSNPVTTATVNVPYTYDVEATDPDGDTLTYFLGEGPTGLSINPATGLITWTPSSSQVGETSVIIEVNDGQLEGTQSFVITVSEPIPGINQPPVITSSPVTVAEKNVPYTYDVEATDPDGDILTYSLALSPIGMSIDPATGLITWTPAQETDAMVTVEVTDGISTVNQDFVISFPSSPLPVLTGITVEPKTMFIPKGDTQTITSVTASYDTAADALIPLADCSYHSDDPTIATVTDGLITAVNTGSTTITVSYTEGSITKTDTIQVTVSLSVIIVYPVHNITQNKSYFAIQNALDDAKSGDSIQV